MPRPRRSIRASGLRTNRRAPYNLRFRSRANPNYLDEISSSDSKEKVVSLPKVETFNVCKKANASAHHTDQYDVEYLVLRRGQKFTFQLILNRPLKADEKVTIILATGHTPYPSKGTLLMFPLGDSNERFGWRMESTAKDENEFELKLSSSSEAIIGMYTTSVQISSDSATNTNKMKESFCMIFNPWNDDDDVYLEGDDSKDEYIMNETGRIWVGSKIKSYGKPWVYGQFETCALEAALRILVISDLPDAALSNPIIVSRTFSKMANSFDDDGILCGNWSGDYSGGVEPTDWISSVDILKKYLETGKEVKYGQCWVFSAILTTLFRAVGIPARSVTNFESAHDNDGSMTIDRHWNHDKKPLPDLNDSIWNFHVWNEVWFRRDDLPSGHDGWQVIDGTPQENSEGVMQCGPAAVAAIKQGSAYLSYDVKFVLAEVNGDIVEWVKNKSGEMNPVWKEPKSVGFNISTKAVGSAKREDLTNHYKYKEGSAEEREVAASVARFSSRKDKLLKFYNFKKAKSIEFSLVGVGYSSGAVEISLDIKSMDAKPVTIDTTLTCVAGYYNGTCNEELKMKTQEIKLPAGETSSMALRLAAEEYLNQIATDATVVVFCQAHVLETGQRYFGKETFAVNKSDVVINAPRSVGVNEEFSVHISFTNDLTLAMTECRLVLEGPGLRALFPVKLLKSTIGPGETIRQTITFRARTAGVKEIVALLHCRQLQNVTGSTTIKFL